MKRYLLCGLLALGLSGCEDPLVVGNQNNPDRDRVFNNPADLEVFISGLFAVQHQGTIGGSNDGLLTQMMVMAMENNSGLANFAMGPRGAIPRTPVSNARGSQGGAGAYHDWFRNHRAARMAALGIAALNRMGTLGDTTRDKRARAFARLVQGIALGHLSLAYDSASILTENDNPEADAAVIVPLSHYSVVNTAALRYLDSAIAIAQTAASGTFLPSVPYQWINGGTVSRDRFIQIARSYKARIRAHRARTPADRAAVDWAAVIADANAGITTDLAPTMDRTNGWDISWVAQHFTTGAANWHQMSQFWLGFADTTPGAFDQWLSKTMPCGRCAFLVVTPDRRVPRGTSRGTRITDAGTQVANSPGPGGTGQRATIPWDSLPYVRNRPPGDDQPGNTIYQSMYDFYRSRAFRNADRIGLPYPVLSAAEIRLLAAEGYLRQGNIGQAATLINVSRTGIGQLPGLDVAAPDSLAPVPGGSACVPRVPDEAAAAPFKSTRCGRIWDALKYELRWETAYVGYGSWFFAGRGWGDLPEGTALHWPVPYQEMDSREQPFYSAGGLGSPTGAAPGHYGLFATGGIY